MSAKDGENGWMTSTPDRRKWDRYPPTMGTTAHLEGRSYRLLDVSRGGLAVYDFSGEPVPEETIVSLHCADEGFYLDALRCRKVSQGQVVSESPHGRGVIHRISLQILENDPELDTKLAPFIRGV